MSGTSLTYALITPLQDEEHNLPRLADCVADQTVTPMSWVLIDTGSTDRTLDVAAAIASRLPFARVVSVASGVAHVRGGPVVRAFHTGLGALDTPADVIIKMDADISFQADYCERLLDAFVSDPGLGLASGICTEIRDGEWRPFFGTRHHVWGASRAYRWPCLQQVLPLEERQGWDEIDSIKAQLSSWRAATLDDLPFRHHRPEGLRDGSGRRRWVAQGDTAHYMGYRFSYLLLRALWRATTDAAALGMVYGYLSAALRREPRCPDAAVRAFLRREQTVRRLPLRLREALGRSF